MGLDEQQIAQVKEIVNEILAQRDTEKEKMYADVCVEMNKNIKVDDSNFKKDMQSLLSWRKKIDTEQENCESKIKSFKNNIENLQQFYDTFNGEK